MLNSNKRAEWAKILFHVLSLAAILDGRARLYLPYFASSWTIMPNPHECCLQEYAHLIIQKMQCTLNKKMLRTAQHLYRATIYATKMPPER